MVSGLLIPGDPEGTRTPNTQIDSLDGQSRKDLHGQDVTSEGGRRLAPDLPRACASDSDLAVIVRAWGGLPPEVRRAVRAMVEGYHGN